MTDRDLDAVTTARLLVRPPRETDRSRFIEDLASQNVCRKLGFTFWKQAPVDGDLRNLYILPA